MHPSVVLAPIDANFVHGSVTLCKPSEMFF